MLALGAALLGDPSKNCISVGAQDLHGESGHLCQTPHLQEGTEETRHLGGKENEGAKAPQARVWEQGAATGWRGTP